MIGIRNSDDTITAIYCHWDGYIETVGKLLVNHYNNEETIRALLSHGNLSCLKQKIYPDSNFVHSYAKPQSDVCIFYKRDRGEKGDNNAITYKSDKAYTNGIAVDYYYLFIDNKWMYTKTFSKPSWKELYPNRPTES